MRVNERAAQVTEGGGELDGEKEGKKKKTSWSMHVVKKIANGERAMTVHAKCRKNVFHTFC
jgi:hypothetical protein